jgi:hypothetical protein
MTSRAKREADELEIVGRLAVYLLEQIGGEIDLHWADLDKYMNHKIHRIVDQRHGRSKFMLLPPEVVSGINAAEDEQTAEKLRLMKQAMTRNLVGGSVVPDQYRELVTAYFDHPHPYRVDKE